MRIEALIPKIDKEHSLAVAVWTDDDIFMIIETYPDRKQLEEGLRNWQNFTSQKGLDKPVPIEIVDDAGTCNVIGELLHED